LFEFYKKQKEMDLKNIQSRLCYYDKRNPDSLADEDEMEYHKSKLIEGKGCSCDNCFYGRTELAEEILRLNSKENESFNTGGQTDAQREKVSHVMREFKEGELTSHGRVVTDDKQAIAIALSEAGIEKKEEGGVIEGQLHADCDSESGCGEKFDVGGTGHIIEAERGEAVIVSNAFKDSVEYTIVGTPSQIASALNVMGGGKNFDGGAKINFGNGKIVDTDKLKKETTDIDVKDDIESGSVIINRSSMFDKNVYEVKGTPKQIASAINSVNGNGVVIQQGAVIKKV
jgi:hypothetical protein